MPTINELLELLPENHYFRDEITFIIDTDLRTISNSSKGNTVIGAQGDHNVNRINFKIPRYYNGIDLSLFILKINYINPAGVVGFFIINDLLVGDDYMLFTWLVSFNVTMTIGETSFVVKMVKEENDTHNVFSTAVSKGVVVPSIMMDNEIEELYRNLMERINVYVSTTPPAFNDIRPFSVWVQMAPTHDSMEILYDTDVHDEYVNALIILTKNGTSKANIYPGNGLAIECFINQILYCTTDGIQIIPYATYVNNEWISENVTIGVRLSLKNFCVNINEESENINYVPTANINITHQPIDNEHADISETLNVNASAIDEVYMSNMNINIQI